MVSNPRVRLDLLTDAPASHRVHDKSIMLANGMRYRLFSAVPRRRAADKGYPALYLLDGNAAFDALTGPWLARHPGLAVIAIGYETGAGFDFDARSRDYTPPPLHGSGLPAGSGRPDRPCGGARAFLDALTLEIIPHVESTIHVDPGRRTLWGHSYGGLFALFLLTQNARTFRSLAIASPTLWWDGGHILTQLRQARWEGVDAIALTKGDLERPTLSDDITIIDPFQTLATLLKARTDGSVSVTMLEDASHRAALDRSLPGALRLADGPDLPPS